MSNGTPPGGAFGARLLSGLLDGMTQRYQQGQSQQREDQLYQTQLADKERLAGAQQEFQTGRDDKNYQRKLDLEQIGQMFDLGVIGVNQDNAKELLGIKGEQSLNEIFARAQASAQYGTAPGSTRQPKYQPPKRLVDDFKFYYPGNDTWIEQMSGDLAGYFQSEEIEKPLRADYDDAVKVIQARNAVSTVLDEQFSPLPTLMGNLGIGPTDKVIDEEDIAILSLYGFDISNIPAKKYTVAGLAHAIVANSQTAEDALGYQIDMTMEKGTDQVGRLTSAIFDILSDRMGDREVQDDSFSGSVKDFGGGLKRDFGDPKREMNKILEFFHLRQPTKPQKKAVGGGGGAG